MGRRLAEAFIEQFSASALSPVGRREPVGVKQVVAWIPSVDVGLKSNHLPGLIMAANDGGGLRNFSLTEQEIIGERGNGRLHAAGLDSERTQQIDQTGETFLRNGEQIESYLVALLADGKVIVIDIFAPKRQLTLDLVFKHLR